MSFNSTASKRLDDFDASVAKRSRASVLVMVSLCFFLSGFAALVYETVWLRQFAILLGTTGQALAIVLSSYMGGLSLGSLLVLRYGSSVRRPLLLYGVLELGIAVAALLIPLGINLARSLGNWMFGGLDEIPEAGQWQISLFGMLVVWTLILIPTSMMGATLPLLSRFVVSRDEHVGPRIGWLYAINTFGAVAGTLVAAFMLLPKVGLGNVVYAGVVANLIVFVLILRLAGLEPKVVSAMTISAPVVETGSQVKDIKPIRASRQTAPRIAANVDGDESLVRFGWVAWLIALSGGASFGYEIIFTRMLSHFLGGSIFAFSTMLAGFLLGIAIGGLAASRVATTRVRAATWFVYCQLGIVMFALAAFYWINQLAGAELRQSGAWSITAQQVFASIITLLPTSTFIGATFPLAIRIYARDERDATGASAWIYFCNTLGGIFGAIATGSFILPRLHYHGATMLALSLNLLIAIVAAFAFRLRIVHGIAFAVVIALPIAYRPQWPENVIRVSAINGKLTQGEILYDRAGPAATVAVFYDWGTTRFQTNGLPESLIAPAGAGIDLHSDATYLAALPSLVRPEIRSMLMIGLGGGVAASLVPQSVQEIDVLELSPSVIEANRAVSGFREIDPLRDPRVQVFVNDGRRALGLTSKRYDTIVSQPSHPWTAGASHLYTVEFARRAKQRLNPGGVFLQWIGMEFVDAELVRSMAATLRQVFPYVRLYRPMGESLLFVASDQIMQPERFGELGADGSIQCHLNEVDRDYFHRLGLITPTHAFSWLTADERGLEKMCGDADVISDANNWLAVRAPALLRGHDAKKTRFFVAGFSPLARSIEEAKQVCPSLDLHALAAMWLRRRGNVYVSKFILPRETDPSRRLLLSSWADDNKQSTASLVDTVAANPDWLSPEIASELLTQSLIDPRRRTRLDKPLKQQCESRLNASQRLIYEIMKAMADGDLGPAEQNDAVLAQVSVDANEFEIATMARLLWRNEKSGVTILTRQELGLEAVYIADRAAAFVKPLSLTWYRAVAAIHAGQPYMALASADVLADTCMVAAKQGDATPGMRRNLQRCLETISQPAASVGVPSWRYQEVLSKLIDTLQQLSELPSAHRSQGQHECLSPAADVALGSDHGVELPDERQAGQGDLHSRGLIQHDPHILDEMLDIESGREVTVDDFRSQVEQCPVRCGTRGNRPQHQCSVESGGLGV